MSFCRPKTERHLVAVIDAPGDEIRWLDFAPNRLYSARGMAQRDGSLHIAGIAAEGSALAVFDTQSWVLRDFSVVEGLADVHSVSLDGNAIIAASTGSDEIVRITHNGVAHAIETLWAPSVEHVDTHHVNSVAFHQGDLFCCAFGPKAGERWKSARNGYLYNITRNKNVAAGLYQPHSIASQADELYLCESARSEVCAIRPSGSVAHGGIRIVTQPGAGYTRGLAVANRQTLIVGESVGRKDATDRTVLNWDEPGEPLGKCATHLHHLDASGAEEKCEIADFSGVALEIYDILLFE